VEAKRLSDNALRHLGGLPLPGNVRQLENLCHWLTVMAPGQTVEVADLPPDLRGASAANSAGSGDAAPDWLAQLDRHADESLLRGERGIIDRLTRDFERTLIIRALQHTGGRRIEAAQLLGLGRNTLTRKVQELGIGETAEEG